MEKVDHEARIVELHLELANLKQGETENIADFIARADIKYFSKKAPWFLGQGWYGSDARYS